MTQTTMSKYATTLEAQRLALPQHVAETFLTSLVRSCASHSGHNRHMSYVMLDVIWT